MSPVKHAISSMKKSRLAMECEKLDPREEKELADASFGAGGMEWEKYSADEQE